MPIDWLVLASAWLTGLLGGVHCAAMCGGIATGFGASSRGNRLRDAGLVNLGRVGGYVLAGVIAGGIGGGILRVARLDWLATGSRMLVGLVLVLVALRLLLPAGKFGFLARPGQALWRRLQPLQRHVMPADTAPRRFALGMLWGWLPCGLVYSTLIWSASQGSATDSALLMLAFGLGTWPVLLATGLAAERVGALLRKRSVRMAGGLLVILFGIWTLPGPHQHWLMGH